MGTPRVDCSKNASLGAFVSRLPRRRVSQGYLLSLNILLRPILKSRPATSGRRRMPFSRLKRRVEIKDAKVNDTSRARASPTNPSIESESSGTITWSVLLFNLNGTPALFLEPADGPCLPPCPGQPSQPKRSSGYNGANQPFTERELLGSKTVALRYWAYCIPLWGSKSDPHPRRRLRRTSILSQFAIFRS